MKHDPRPMQARWGSDMTLVTITPGPVLSVYDNGKLIVQAKLSMQEALHLLKELAEEIEL